MRIVITGATGNVGTSVIAALADEHAVDEIVAIARRPAELHDARVSFAVADVARDDLATLFAGADAVVHLAWLIQPSRDERTLRAVNVDGTRRVLDAAAYAGVGAVVVASSVGAYSPGPKDRAVDESWPTQGIPSLFYSRHKAEIERMLDRFEQDRPGTRVVRLRPGLIFKREAATGIRRLFAGPLLPSALLRRALIPVVPDVARLRFQAVHSLDVGDAYRRAVLADVRGAFNVAAEPVLDPRVLAEALGARRVPVRAGLLRRAADLSWRLRLQPSPAGWIDLALGVPLMDCGRVRRELGWEPQFSATDALLELLDGLRDGADFPTPPLAAATTGPLRLRELRSGVGAST
ncbi:MAG TPA: NAD-dependent epimerase/dehydratase family protein [Conexibacter sp.]|jgi:nucleoside-diphosphate-sugar epimerase|nr:NAD-dependent epimerase/dehydratase family protein [Conexibacter sp.]